MQMLHIWVWERFKYIPSDDMVVEQLTAIYKKHNIIPIRVNGVVNKGGALNCISWNIKI